MTRLKMKNYNAMLTKSKKMKKKKKKQKCQHHYLEKLIKMNLTGDEILSSNQKQIIEQAKFAYSPFEKIFEKQTEKQVGGVGT